MSTRFRPGLPGVQPAVQCTSATYDGVGSSHSCWAHSAVWPLFAGATTSCCTSAAHHHTLRQPRPVGRSHHRERVHSAHALLFLYSKQRVGPVFILKTRPTKRALPSQDAQWGCGACGQRACGRDCPKIVPAGVAATLQRLGVRRLA